MPALAKAFFMFSDIEVRHGFSAPICENPATIFLSAEKLNDDAITSAAIASKTFFTIMFPSSLDVVCGSQAIA
jgi:hypothetical protein